MRPRRSRFSDLKPLIGTILGAGIPYVFSADPILIMIGAVSGGAVGLAERNGDAHDFLVELLEEDGFFDRLDERRRRGDFDDE